MALFLKTKLCKFHMAGMCTRGSACKFAHGETELSQPPDFSKTELCANFLRTGACAHGAACKFAHSKEELRPRLVDRILQAAQDQASVNASTEAPPEPQEPRPQLPHGEQPLPARSGPQRPALGVSPKSSKGSSTVELDNHHKGQRSCGLSLEEVEALSRQSTQDELDDMDDLCPQPDDRPRSRQSSHTSSASSSHWFGSEQSGCPRYSASDFSSGPAESPHGGLQASHTLDEAPRRGAILDRLDEARESQSSSAPQEPENQDFDEKTEEDIDCSPCSDIIYARVRVKNTFIHMLDSESSCDSRVIKTCPALPDLA